MALNQIPEQEFNARLVKVMDAIIPKGKGETHELQELFHLHNDKFELRETGIFCGGCVKRVFDRMKIIYQGIKNGI